MGFDAIVTGAGIVLLVCFGSILLCFLLGAVGFTPAGVAAASCASAWQSVIGNVVKGTCFALLQSLAATRVLANCAVLAAIVATATIAGLYYYLSEKDFDTLVHNTNVTTTAIVNNVTAMASDIYGSMSNLTAKPMDEFKIGFDNFVQDANDTTRAMFNNITAWANTVQMPNLTEPANKFKAIFNSICENCTIF